MLSRRRRGAKKRYVSINEKLYEQARAFADREDLEFWSVVETAIEDFLEDREDDTFVARTSPAPAANGSARAGAAK